MTSGLINPKITIGLEQIIGSAPTSRRPSAAK
jgi:hypothetical protein